MVMNVEIISNEIIKPSSPTPHHLRNFKLSFLDQIAPPLYIPIILFYDSKKDGDVDPFERSLSLKESLAETLTRYYPLAGIPINEDFSINCNDEGVDYIQARVPCKLSQMVDNPKGKELIQLLPFEPYHSCAENIGKEILLAVQYNIFECGGVAIAVCVSHKIADGTSAVTFVNAWAGTSRGASEVISPSFDATLHFPPRDTTGFMPNEAMSKEKIVTKRFVFDKSSIATLRKEASIAFGPEDRGPSRVEAISAFIWKRFMAMAKAKQGNNKPKLFAALHAVNLRERMVPQLPVHSFGNLWRIVIATSPVEIEKDYRFLMSQLRNSIMEINAEFLTKLKDDVGHLDSIKKAGKQFSHGEIEFCNFTSWCRFPVYEVDFGMGKPTWVCSPNRPCKNVVVMMSTKDGDGIETWVNMKKEDMDMFEHDQELLSYASSADGE
jgi:shikimate O-hydroxycinnamoyltransferase